MAKRVTIADVGAAAGVSAMTVSSVLNGRPGASDETRRRVLEAAKRLGYVPNLAARGLKGGRTNLVGALTHDLTGQYTLEIIRGIADELATMEMEVLISAAYHNATRERERIELLSKGRVDGLLLISPVLAPDTLRLLHTPPCPVIVIDPRQLAIDLPTVTANNYHGMRSATEHLVALGHRDIAYLGGDPDFDASTARSKGFHDAVHLAGLTVPDGYVHACDFTYLSGFRAASELLDAHRPTAVVAAADLIAHGCMDAARARGLRIPEDLSVVGFDDLPQSAHLFPGLTTARQPLHDMGVTGVRMLLGLLDGRRPPTEHVDLPTTLVVRGSTAAPPPASTTGA